MRVMQRLANLRHRARQGKGRYDGHALISSAASRPAHSRSHNPQHRIFQLAREAALARRLGEAPAHERVARCAYQVIPGMEFKGLIPGARDADDGRNRKNPRILLGLGVCYIFPIMATTEEKLETLFAKVRALPKPRQELAVEALSEITDEETYALSDDERAVLESALERAKRGEFASHADIDEVLNKPWS
jgi:hypothetical protein